MKGKPVQRMGPLGTRCASELCALDRGSRGAWVGLGSADPRARGDTSRPPRPPSTLVGAPAGPAAAPLPHGKQVRPRGGLPPSPACWAQLPPLPRRGAWGLEKKPMTPTEGTLFPVSPLPSRGDRTMESRVCYCYFQLGKTVNVRVHADRK